MLKELRKDNEGVVFVTVIMMITVMIALVVSILGLNTTRVKTTEREIRQIQAELLAEGALDLFLSNQLSNSAGNFISDSIYIGPYLFNISANLYSSGTGIFGTSQVNIDVVYSE